MERYWCELSVSCTNGISSHLAMTSILFPLMAYFMTFHHVFPRLTHNFLHYFLSVFIFVSFSSVIKLHFYLHDK
jgi:hypothetical protein